MIEVVVKVKVQDDDHKQILTRLVQQHLTTLTKHKFHKGNLYIAFNIDEPEGTNDKDT